MNKEEIVKYQKIKKEVFTTSEVIKDSFVNVINKLKEDDYVLIENQRQKITIVAQDINTYSINKKVTKKSFDGKVKTIEDNKLLLKSLIKENVFYLMKFEFDNITFPDVESIIENSRYYKDKYQLQITNQLMDGFKFIINSPKDLDYYMFLNLNAIVAENQALEWGVLRKNKVYITGTSYIPPLPTKKLVEGLFNSFHNSQDKYKAAAQLLVKLIKAQPFYDGNKRTAFLAVNRLLIENHLGILSVSDRHFNEFNKLLNDYYNDEASIDEIIKFIVDKCLFNTK